MVTFSHHGTEQKSPFQCMAKPPWRGKAHALIVLGSYALFEVYTWQLLEVGYWIWRTFSLLIHKHFFKVSWGPGYERKFFSLCLRICLYNVCGDRAFPWSIAESIEREKGISVLVPHEAPEGTWAVSQLCDGSRTSGGSSVHLYFLLQKSCLQRQSWCPVSFQIGIGYSGDTMPSLQCKTAWSHVREPGLLNYCEVLLLNAVLISLSSSGSLAQWEDKDWLCLWLLLPCWMNLSSSAWHFQFFLAFPALAIQGKQGLSIPCLEDTSLN